MIYAVNIAKAEEPISRWFAVVFSVAVAVKCSVLSGGQFSVCGSVTDNLPARRVIQYHDLSATSHADLLLSTAILFQVRPSPLEFLPRDTLLCKAR